MMLELLSFLKITHLQTHIEHFNLVAHYVFSLGFYIKVKLGGKRIMCNNFSKILDQNQNPILLNNASNIFTKCSQHVQYLNSLKINGMNIQLTLNIKIYIEDLSKCLLEHSYFLQWIPIRLQNQYQYNSVNF